MTDTRAEALVRTASLQGIGKSLGMTRRANENWDDFASRCHYRVDALLREHAHRKGDAKIITFMDVHDAIEACFP